MVAAATLRIWWAETFAGDGSIRGSDEYISYEYNRGVIEYCGTLTNDIGASINGGYYSNAVDMESSTVINDGAINGGSFADGVNQTGGTLTNETTGSIGGASGKGVLASCSSRRSGCAPNS